MAKASLGMKAVPKVNTSLTYRMAFFRDVLEATLNYGAHGKFVAKWLDKLEKEASAPVAPEKAPRVDVPAATAAEEIPAPASTS
jgi:thioredoxin-dependent peroxiredoxin